MFYKNNLPLKHISVKVPKLSKTNTIKKTGYTPIKGIYI